MKKLHDLGHTYDGPTAASSDDKKYYPSARIPQAALDSVPTDGRKFMMLVEGRVRSVNNDDESLDIELLRCCADKTEAGEPKGEYARPKQRTLRDSMEDAKKGA